MFSELSAKQWVQVSAAVMQLALAIGAVRTRSRSALRWPFALLCVAGFVSQLSGVAHVVTRAAAFHLLDHAAAPMIGAAMHFVVGFVGRRRRLVTLTRATYLGFAALGLAALLGVSTRPATRPAWSLVFLGGLVVVVIVGAALLGRHLVRARGEERHHTWRVLAAFVGGLSLGATELANDFLPFRGLSDVAAITATVVLAPLLTDRSPLRDRPTDPLALVRWLALAVVAVGVYVGIFGTFEGGTLAIALACAAGTLLLVLLVTRANERRSAEATRRERLLWAGRLSEQLAHDVQNPLAAIQGAAQFLLEERRRAGSANDDEREMLELVEAQARRIKGILMRYRRLAEVELTIDRIDVVALARSVAHACRRRFPELEFVCAGEAHASVLGDADLLSVAIEGVVVNAAEASRPGQRVTIDVREDDQVVRLRVGDEGAGMDARTREEVFDEYFTTKATGSGLGLAFSRRVVETHGGSIALESDEGAGTTVVFVLPKRPPDEGADDE